MSTLIHFWINDKLYTSSNPNELLVTFLHEHALHGTKLVCGQGGCGACTVTMQSTLKDGTIQQLPINACLRPVGACHELKFYTIEGLDAQRAAIHSCKSAVGAACAGTCSTHQHDCAGSLASGRTTPSVTSHSCRSSPHLSGISCSSSPGHSCSNTPALKPVRRFSRKSGRPPMHSPTLTAASTPAMTPTFAPSTAMTPSIAPSELSLDNDFADFRIDDFGRSRTGTLCSETSVATLDSDMNELSKIDIHLDEDDNFSLDGHHNDGKIHPMHGDTLIRDKDALLNATSTRSLPQGVTSALDLIRAAAMTETTAIHDTAVATQQPVNLADPRKVLAEYGGTQCGFCSPGFVMTTHAAQMNAAACKSSLTTLDIEDLYSGNICRCTGYRSILCGMKTLAADGNKDELEHTPAYTWDESKGYGNKAMKDKNVTVIDVPIHDRAEEGRNPTPDARKEKDLALPANLLQDVSEQHVAITTAKAKEDAVYEHRWFYPEDEHELFDLIASLPVHSVYKLVHGNTSYGIYPTQEYVNVHTFMDIKHIQEWIGIMHKPKAIVMGASTTLNEIIDVCKEQLHVLPHSTQFKSMLQHLKRVAGQQVRNAGSIGGVFAMAKKWNFPSDIVIMLGAAGVIVNFWTWSDNAKERTLMSLPFFDATGNKQDFAHFVGNFVIRSVELPVLRSDVSFHTTRVAQRLQHAHPLINTGFYFDTQSKQLPLLVVGNIGNAEPHSDRFEGLQVMTGVLALVKTAKTLYDIHHTSKWNKETLALLMQTIEAELRSLVFTSAIQSDPEQRIYITVNLFKKFLIKYIIPTNNDCITESERNSVDDIYEVRQSTRSTGSQNFFINKSQVPLSEPIIKSSALKQTSGKTEYAQSHIPDGCLHAGFVLSERTTGVIKGFTESTIVIKRLINYFKVQFNQHFTEDQFHIYTAKDIGPGNLLNRMDYLYSDSYPPAEAYQAFGGLYLPWQQFPVYMLAVQDVHFYGQALAIVVAPDQTTMKHAITYLASQQADFVQWDETVELGTPILTIKESKAAKEVVIEGRKVPTQFYLKSPLTEPPKNFPAGEIKQNPERFDEYLSTIPKPCPERTVKPERHIDFTKYESNPDYIVFSGEHEVGSQYHFYMETQSAVAEYQGVKETKPDGTPTVAIKLISSTQNVQETQGFTQAILNDLKDGNNYAVDLELRQIGGGFGGKQVQAVYTAAGAAFCAAKLQKPVRFVMDRDSDMKMIGKRHAASIQYKLAARADNGKIEALHLDTDLDAGCNYDIFAITYAVLNLMMESSDNAYDIKEFVINGNAWFTHKASNTGFRSFGVVQIHQLVEHAIEVLSEHPKLAKHLTAWDVRAINMYRWAAAPERDMSGKTIWTEDTPFNIVGFPMINCNLDGIWNDIDQLCSTIDLDNVSATPARRSSFTPTAYAAQASQYGSGANYKALVAKIDHFNRTHKYKKRGISALPLKYPVGFTPVMMNKGVARLAITKDGQVNVYAFGTEMGQGLDVKMNQTAAFNLGVSSTVCHYQWIHTSELPSVDEYFLPPTAASTGSDLNGQAVILAANTLNKWLEDVLGSDSPLWQAYVRNNHKWYIPAQYDDNQRMIEPEVNMWSYVVKVLEDKQLLPYATPLQYYESPGLKDLDPVTKTGFPYWYMSYAAALSIVEVDVLTGEFYTLHSDIVYDTGFSMNPAIDVGQMEGGFVQGLGYVTCEEIQFKEQKDDAGERGQLLTTNTWLYKMPTTTEIPKSFNLFMYPLHSHVESTGIDFKKDGVAGSTTHNSLTGRRIPWHKRDGYNHVIDTYGVRSSKTTGEPPFVLANTVFFAIRAAIRAYRTQELNDVKPFTFTSPATTFKIVKACQA